jgi:hypothetical protein
MENFLEEKIEFNNKKLTLSDEYDCIELNGDYKIKFKDGKIFLTKRSFTYPKNYDGCRKIMADKNQSDCQPLSEFMHSDINSNGLEKISKFAKLITCRNAYWTLYNKNYSPNFKEFDVKYVIYGLKGQIKKDITKTRNTILAFPTKEMRDMFYKNFEKEIQECIDFI